MAVSLFACCMAQVIARETEEADKVKSVVSQEEAVASKEAAGVKAIKVPSNSYCTIRCCVCCLVCYSICYKWQSSVSTAGSLGNL